MDGWDGLVKVQGLHPTGLKIDVCRCSIHPDLLGEQKRNNLIPKTLKLVEHTAGGGSCGPIEPFSFHLLDF